MGGAVLGAAVGLHLHDDPGGAALARIADEECSQERVGGSDDVAWRCDIGIQIADGLHPVANPVVDSFGAIYATMSGAAGHKTPVSVYKIEPDLRPKPLVSEILNATGLAIDNSGLLYVSSRHDGIVYQVSPSGNAVTYVEGMGVATGIVFDREDNLYVGDRSGTIFKISPDRQIFVFAEYPYQVPAVVS